MTVMGFAWHNRTVLVTGARGFKGSWLSATLVDLGAKVLAIVRDQELPDSAFEALGSMIGSSR